MARVHTERAINVLAGIMDQTSAPEAARISAAQALLDRGWGKAAQPIENGEDGAFQVVQRIERIIADPANPDRKSV